MKLLRTIVSSLPPVGLLVLQLSCGGADTSGPGGGGVATTIAPNSATTQTAAPETQVAALPSVLVSDGSGAPMTGVPVTFTVTTGGGSVTGGSATTNSAGIATVGSWTLGAAPEGNTLSATTGTLTAIKFTACGTAIHALGSTVDSQLSLTDCQLSDGTFIDFYTVTVPTTGTYIFSQTSGVFDTYLGVFTAGAVVIGVNDDFGAVGITDSRVKVIVPAGTYIVGANSFDANAIGTYSLASAASATPVTNCEDVFVLPGITSPQALETTDCANIGFYSDNYVIFLTTGQSITVSMTSSVVDSYLEIRRDGSTAVLAANDNIDATTKNAQFTYTAPASGFYIILAASVVAGATGDYTFDIH
jgi:hypothetical protein